jgi:hypothetical protein
VILPQPMMTHITWQNVLIEGAVIEALDSASVTTCSKDQRVKGSPVPTIAQDEDAA